MRISIIEMPLVPIFRKNAQLWPFQPRFAQKWILGWEIQKSKSGFGISILEILCVPIFRQNGQLWIFMLKFAQKWILGSKIWKSNSKLSVLSKNWYTWYLKDAGSYSNICFINFQLLIPLWANLDKKSLSCSFCLKVGGYWLLFQHFLS